MNTVSDETLAALATSLTDAEQTRVARGRLTAEVPELTAVDAYEIQRMNIERRVADGASIRGHKIGLTARSMQEHFGVSEPDYGQLLDEMFVLEATEVPFERFIQPRAELEPAFVLRRRLEGPGVTAADVIRATDFVLPALEIIDSRIRDWDILLQDTIADNGSSGAVVLGARPMKLRALDVRDLGAEMTIDGRPAGAGSTRDILGSPVNCIVWLANALGRHGVALEADHVVLPGTPILAQPVGPGQTVVGRLDALGSVEVTFA